ncbi:MAG TPA: phosphoribosylformylglycinamidine synthase subunit PurQ, partial [Candidatus Limnocylindrales bacterium]|nr:phosphoribosylformylglycinamidine synthase subunit PurQ [Candidatus Limnocylindrales bacterium]
MSHGPRVAVAVFPGTWSERDFLHVAPLIGWDARAVWHTERELGAVDAVVLPGGFAHGDHLRTGAIARFSPLMHAVEAYAAAGGPVLGSCNGFQILCEAGMLPGVLLRNDHLQFRCDWQWLRVERSIGPWLADEEVGAGDVINLPISHGEGRYHADPEVLDELERDGRVVLRYADADGRVVPDANPNGSANGIAGIVNEG